MDQLPMSLFAQIGGVERGGNAAVAGRPLVSPPSDHHIIRTVDRAKAHGGWETCASACRAETHILETAATTPTEFDQAPAVSTRNSGFRRYRRVVRMPAEEARRQSQVVQTAWKAIGSTAEAMAFLNTHHDQLGARPLELAMASDEGLVEVERILAGTARAEGVTP